MTHKTAGYRGGYVAWPIAVTAFPITITRFIDSHIGTRLAYHVGAMGATYGCFAVRCGSITRKEYRESATRAWIDLSL